MTDAPDHRSQWDADGTVDHHRRRHPARSVRLGAGHALHIHRPSVYAEGVEDIVAYLRRFQENAPGGHFVTEAFLDHHDRSLARWTMVLGDGTVVGTGASFATYDALTSMTGFIDVPAGS